MIKWEAWIGQKIVRMESEDGATVIVVEDGRGTKFFSDPGLYFRLDDVHGPLWPEEEKRGAKWLTK
jgi:hypothetical protein